MSFSISFLKNIVEYSTIAEKNISNIKNTKEFCFCVEFICVYHLFLYYIEVLTFFHLIYSKIVSKIVESACNLGCDY